MTEFRGVAAGSPWARTRPEVGRRRLTRMAVPGLVVALMGSGCATVRSTAEPDFAASRPAGLTYFLPMRQARLTVTRTARDTVTPTRERDQKVVALAAADVRVAAAKTRREQAYAVLQTLPEGATARAEQIRIAELAAAEETLLRAAAEALRGEVAELTRRVEAAHASGGGCVYSTKIELLPAQADPTARFVADLPHNYFRDDTVRLNVSPTGLLTSANVVAVDQTGQVLVELAGLAGALEGAGGGPKALAERAAGTPAVPCEGVPSFVRIFDPMQSGQVNAVNRDLRNSSFPFSLQATSAGQSGSDNARPNSASEEISASGLYYRSPVPVLVELRYLPPGASSQASGDEPAGTPVDAVVMMLPQAGPTSYLPMRANAFVKTTSDVQFVEGSVAAWSSERPSEVLSVARLPAQAIEAFAGALSRILTLRVETSTSREALGAQQMEEQVQLERHRLLMDCIARARRDGTDVTACLPETP